MYRPPDFNNPYLGVDEDGFDKEYDGYIAFEAGADALWDGLVKVDVSFKVLEDGSFLIDPGVGFEEWTKGKWVFLPEESND